MNRNLSLAGELLKRWSAVGLLVLALMASMVGQTAHRANRIQQGLSSAAVVKIAGSVHPLTREAADLGAVAPSTRMDGLTLSVMPSAAEQRELKKLMAELQEPKSALYHKWLTQEQFGARFGLTDGDLEKLTGWLKSQGFAVTGVSPSRNQINFSGTAAQVQMAFRTQIHRYQLNGDVRLSNAGDISLPKALQGVVTHVGGLSGFRPQSHGKPAPQFTSAVLGYHYMTPSDWATIYGVNQVYLAGFKGDGVHIGVVGQTYIPETDVAAFRIAAGLGGANATSMTVTNLNYACISSSNCTATAGESVAELYNADMDVEWAGGIAPNATVDYIYSAASDTSHSALDALAYGITTYQVSGKPVPVLSVSYGFCESNIFSYQTYEAEMDGYLAEAAVQGQTVVSSSGDAGAGCTYGSENVSVVIGADSVWPASSPNVTAVGGTKFSGDGSDTYGDKYWSSSAGTDQPSSAQSYIPETTWNDSSADLALNPLAPLSTSGGGVSNFYAQPDYQQNLSPVDELGNPVAAKRYIPDLAFAASADHDGYLICTPEFLASAASASDTAGPSCSNSTFRDATSSVYAAGGTSAAGASFAGVMALMVQKYGPLGNFNPLLYGMHANYPQAFHDVTAGNNNVPCSVTTSPCLNYAVGYAAGTGYDLATGLGSLDANGFLTNFISNNVVQTLTTISASVNPATMGNSTDLTATVSSVTPSALSGKVTFLASNSVGGSTSSTYSLGTVDISGNDSAQATLTVNVKTGNKFIAGKNTITASYSGGEIDGPPAVSIAGSSGSMTLAASATPTTIVESVTPANIPLGDNSSRLTLTATVAANDGSIPFGQVQFYVNGVKVGPVGSGSGCVNTSSPVDMDQASGIATTPDICPTAANGFVLGSNVITATYVPYGGCPDNPALSPNCVAISAVAPYIPSTVTATATMAAPKYTIAANINGGSVALIAGQSQNVALELDSATYWDTATLTVTPSSSLITATLSATKVPLTPGAHAFVNVTLNATNMAKRRSPARPWGAGALALGAVLAGIPLARRRKRVATVLMLALAVSLLFFAASCSSTSARSYTVEVQGTGGVSTQFTVNVQ